MNLWKRLKERHQAFGEWQPPDDHWLTKLLKDSRIPAIKEAAKPNISIYARLFWVGVFLLCIGLSIVFVKVALFLYFKFPLLFAFHSKRVRVEDIRIGTVAVCPSESLIEEQVEMATKMFDEAQRTNKATYKGIEWIWERIVRVLYLLQHVCVAQAGPNSMHDMVQNERLSTALAQIDEQLHFETFKMYDNPEDEEMKNHLIPFIKEGLVNCKEILLYCSFGSKVYECKEIFNLVLTDIGGCCLFNSIAEQALKKHRTLLSLIQGSNQTLVAEWKRLGADQHIIEGLIRNATDNPLELPVTQRVGGYSFGLSFVIKFLTKARTCKQFDGSGSRIAIYPTHDNANIRPISLEVPQNYNVQIGLYPDLELANEDVRPYAPNVRDCCFAKDSYPECQLKYYHEYSETNCLSECMANITRAKCDCSVLSMPKEPGDVLCNPSQLACVKEVQLEAAYNGISHMCPKCLPSCNSLKIRTIVTMSPISKTSPPPRIAELYSKNISASIVSIYYVDNWYIVKEIFERFGWIEITLIVLGLLGTTNGFSFIDVARVSEAIVKAVKTCSDKVKVAYNAVFSLLGMINIVTDLVVPGVRPLDLASFVLARKETEEEDNFEDAQDNSESNDHDHEDPVDPGEMRESTPVVPFDEEEEDDDEEEEDKEEIKAVEVDVLADGKEKKEKVDGNVGWTALSAGFTASCVAIGRETWDECFDSTIKTNQPNNENENAEEDPEAITKSNDEDLPFNQSIAETTPKIEEVELEIIGAKKETNEQIEAERESSAGELGPVSHGFIQAGKVGATAVWIFDNQVENEMVNLANDTKAEWVICNAKHASAKIDAKKEDVKAIEKFVITGEVGRNCASVGFMFASVALGRDNLYECNTDEHMDALEDTVPGPDSPGDSNIPLGERPDPGESNMEIGESEPGPSHGVRCPWSKQKPDIENQMDDESSDEEFESLWGNILFVDELARLQARRRGLKRKSNMDSDDYFDSD